MGQPFQSADGCFADPASAGKIGLGEPSAFSPCGQLVSRVGTEVGHQSPRFGKGQLDSVTSGLREYGYPLNSSATVSLIWSSIGQVELLDTGTLYRGNLPFDRSISGREAHRAVSSAMESSAR